MLEPKKEKQKKKTNPLPSGLLNIVTPNEMHEIPFLSPVTIWRLQPFRQLSFVHIYIYAGLLL